MIDPVSILAAGFSIVDVTLRVINYLKDIKAATDTIDDDIEGLIDEVTALMTVHEQLEQVYLKNINDDALEEKEKILWVKLAQTLKGGRNLTQKLDVAIRKFYGENLIVTGRRDALFKQYRKRSRNGIISGLRSQINTYHGALNIWLANISMCAMLLKTLATFHVHTDARAGTRRVRII